jgi:hypothetical protein
MTTTTADHFTVPDFGTAGRFIVAGTTIAVSDGITLTTTVGPITTTVLTGPSGRGIDMTSSGDIPSGGICITATVIGADWVAVGPMGEHPFGRYRIGTVPRPGIPLVVTGRRPDIREVWHHPHSPITAAPTTGLSTATGAGGAKHLGR